MSQNPTPTDRIGVSVIRTVAPIVVGIIAGWLLKFGIELPEGFLDQHISEIIATVYYVLARLAETKLGPAYGKLLVIAKKPEYDLRYEDIAA